MLVLGSVILQTPINSEELQNPNPKKSESHPLAHSAGRQPEEKKHAPFASLFGLTW